MINVSMLSILPFILHLVIVKSSIFLLFSVAGEEQAGNKMIAKVNINNGFITQIKIVLKTNLTKNHSRTN